VLSNIIIYFPEGMPNGLDAINSAGLKLTPVFVGGDADYIKEGSKGQTNL